MKILRKIENAINTCKGRGIRPSVLIINSQHERELFTECGVDKSTSAEDYILDKFQVELFIIPTPKQTAPQALGDYLLDK